MHYTAGSYARVLVCVQPHSQRAVHSSAYATVSDPSMLGGGAHRGVPVITRVDQPLLMGTAPSPRISVKPSPHHRHHAAQPQPQHHHQQQQQQQQPPPVQHPPAAVMPGPLPTSLATTAAPPHDGKYHARRVDKLSRSSRPPPYSGF